MGCGYRETCCVQFHVGGTSRRDCSPNSTLTELHRLSSTFNKGDPPFRHILTYLLFIVTLVSDMTSCKHAARVFTSLWKLKYGDGDI